MRAVFRRRILVLHSRDRKRRAKGISDERVTHRQQEIKSRLNDGMSVRDIASDLGITRNGVYQHIHSMRRRGLLPRGYTPTGRKLHARAQLPDHEIGELERSEADLAIRLLLTEIKRTRDELERITRRLSAIVSE
jgi:DNA-binding CsgD family transcriptional regulator